MSRMQVLSARRFRGSSRGPYRSCTKPKRGSSTGPVRCLRQIYFKFHRTKLLATSYALKQRLPSSFDKGYLLKAKRNDFDFLRNLIGKRFAELILGADKFRIRVKRRNAQQFNFYCGENKQGKKVALLEVF